MTDFERDFMGDLGFDLDDPKVRAAMDDARAHARLIETLAALRDDQGLKQAEIAERMETTQSRVSSFERAGSDPRLSTLLRYARAVNAQLAILPHTLPPGWHDAGSENLNFTVDEEPAQEHRQLQVQA